jgi:hypothetical protein
MASLLEQQTRAIIEAEMLKPEVWNHVQEGVLLHKALPINLVKYGDIQNGFVEQLDTDIQFTVAQFHQVIRSMKEYKKNERMSNIVEMYEKQKALKESLQRTQERL